MRALKSVGSFGLYAKYLIKLFNDKEKGHLVLELIKKIEQEQLHRTEIEFDEKSELLDQTAVIFMEISASKSGIIFHSNINAERMFGYSRGELVGQNVNVIMPSIFSLNHDRILSHYLQTGKKTLIDKESHRWGKTRTGHLFPLIILIKQVSSAYSESASSQVYASIRPKLYLKETASLVLDLADNVHETTSSALRLFPLLRKTPLQLPI